MDTDQRRQQLAIYSAAPEMLLSAMDRYPEEMWQWRPTEDEFSIHEIFLHVADSEANSYVRARHLIAQPGSTVSAYDEPVWARKLDYHEQDVPTAVQLFGLLRLQTAQLLWDLPEETWANTVVHPESGVMSMDQWLGIYTRHVPEHIAQMERVYQAWLEEEGDEFDEAELFFE